MTTIKTKARTIGSNLDIAVANLQSALAIIDRARLDARTIRQDENSSHFVFVEKAMLCEIADILSRHTKVPDDKKQVFERFMRFFYTDVKE